MSAAKPVRSQDTPLKRVARRVFSNREVGPAIALITLAIFFQIQSHGKFITSGSLSAVAALSASVGIVSIGVTMLMISGEFDLSVSATFALAPIVAGTLFRDLGWPLIWAVVLALVIVAFVGWLNGIITAVAGVPSFIVTLGMLFVVTTANRLIVGGFPVDIIDEHGFLKKILGADVPGTPIAAPFLWMVVLAVILTVVLRRTTFGNWTFAAGTHGGDTARAMGVPVQRVKLANFTLTATLAGLGGILQFADFGSSSVASGEDLNLLAIVAVVVGGTSLFGTKGTVIGSLLGALILGSLKSGLILIGTPGGYYIGLVGVLLVVAAALNARLLTAREWAEEFDVPMRDASGHPILELEGITKRFGKVLAAKDVDLKIHSGEVVGLVGDNGAGKSTVVKMISGYIKPTTGVMKVDGKPVKFSSPSEARAAGIETVYQDLAIVNDVSLWRNFFLGKEESRRVLGVKFLRSRKMAQACEEQLGILGLTSVESAEQTAATLSGGERQSLAISRAIHFESRLLLLDEPVAALSVRETRRVFSSIDRAKEEGLGVLYIDHNMDHVLPVADRVAIMHHGGISRIVERGEMTAGELADAVAASGSHAAAPGES